MAISRTFGSSKDNLTQGENTLAQKNRVAFKEQETTEEETVPGNKGDKDQEEIVDIDLIYCDHCKRSYTPARSKKLCQSFGTDGVPKCLSLTRKRKKFNSSKVCDKKLFARLFPKFVPHNHLPLYKSWVKMRIVNNENLNIEDKKLAVESRKHIARAHPTESKVKGRKSKTRQKAKWRIESEQFRAAMKASRVI
jgi:hypothetical protein